MIFGLLDTEDNLWMGNEKGPLLYEDETFARVCAMICDRSLHQRAGRTRAKEFREVSVRLRDEKPLLEPAAEALSKLEEGLL